MNGNQLILVVDDDEEMLRMLNVLLELEGYDVITTADGRSAVTLLVECGPDLVILDVVMPGLDGIETLRRLRKIDQNLPVIMLTAHPREENITEALKLGIDGFFPKGENFNRLLIIINTILNRLKRK